MDSYVHDVKNEMLDDDDYESGSSILEKRVNPSVGSVKQLVQGKVYNKSKVNLTKKAEIKKQEEMEAHRYDRMADDLSLFKEQELNTRTADGKVRYSSDNFHLTSIEDRTQSFV